MNGSWAGSRPTAPTLVFPKLTHYKRGRAVIRHNHCNTHTTCMMQNWANMCWFYSQISEQTKHQIDPKPNQTAFCMILNKGYYLVAGWPCSRGRGWGRRRRRALPRPTSWSRSPITGWKVGTSTSRRWRQGRGTEEQPPTTSWWSWTIKLSSDYQVDGRSRTQSLSLSTFRPRLNQIEVDQHYNNYEDGSSSASISATAASSARTSKSLDEQWVATQSSTWTSLGWRT